MKNYQRLLLLLFILLLNGYFFKSTFAQEKEVKWNGKIEYKNRIRIIKNPKCPLFGKIKFDLKEDLSIGGKEGENFMFYRGVKIGVDNEDNIYILDLGNCRVQKFDEKGNFIKTIGGKGQGPGEFEQPTDIYIDKNIYIMESFNRKLHIYDNNGNFIETIKFTNYVNYLSEKTEGYFIAKITSYKKEGRFIEIVLMNSNGKISKVIASFPFPIRVIRKKGVVFGTVNPYEPYIYFSPLKSGKGIYGYSLNYKLFVINAEGKIEFIIEKGESPVPITKKEKNKIIMDKYLSLQDLLRKSKRKGIELSRRDIKRLLFFPKHRPFYRKILSDELDNIYVKRIESVLKKQKFITFDFFNSKGIYLYEIKTSEEPDIIKNGYLYNYIQDDMGYIKIKRYKIKNWEKIRNYSSFLPKSYK